MISFTGNLGDGLTRTYASGISYSPLGGLLKEQFGTSTAVYHKIHYNSRAQICDVRASNVNDEWGGELGALVNHYSTAWVHCGSGSDNNGNVLMSQTIFNSVYFEDRYSYDSLNRLTGVNEYQNGATLTGTQEYDYDRWGNRTIKPTSTFGTNKQFTVNAANNRLGVASGQPGVMEYDLAGNLTNDTYTGAGNRTYDGENKITSAWGGNNQAQLYRYDGSGQRIKRTVNSVEIWHVYGFGGESVAEYAANAAAASPQKEYGYRNGQLLVATGETVWADDAVPAGAAIAGDGESWNWVSSNPSAFSGTTAHQSNIVAGLHQHYFYGATATLSVNAGDKLVAYVYLDPANMPSQIMLQWAEGGSWEHRAYWGANNLPWGVDGTNSRRYMGPLPAAGTWVKLEVPASLVGLEGYTLHGMAFSLWGGRATWDRAGRTTGPNWLVSDHLSTPRMVIDQTGSLANVKRHDYLPFGEELFPPAGGRSAALGYAGGDGVRQQFTLYERDNETGLDYAQARYYNPMQGRFSGPDPLLASAEVTQPQTWNRYSYAENSPLIFVDPSGLVSAYSGPINAFTTSDEEDRHISIITTGYDPALGIYRGEVTIEHTPDGGGYTQTQTLDRPTPEQLGQAVNSMVNNTPNLVAQRGGGRRTGRPTGGNPTNNPLNWRLVDNGRGKRTWRYVGPRTWRDGLVTVGGNWVVGRDARPIAPPPSYRNHHVFPQQQSLRPFFTAAGVNIHETTVRIPEWLHNRIHRGAGGGEWNQRWETFFRQNPRADRNQIYEFAFRLSLQYNLPSHAISVGPYR